MCDAEETGGGSLNMAWIIAMSWPQREPASTQSVVITSI